jgi:hypothetical protein
MVTNYIAQAFTTQFSARYGAFYTLVPCVSLEVLVFPCFGLLATCRSMEKLLLFDHDPFDRALDVGVLSTVARIKVCKPETETGDKIWLS